MQYQSLLHWAILTIRRVVRDIEMYVAQVNCGRGGSWTAKATAKDSKELQSGEPE